jgi:hypothetical protein
MNACRCGRLAYRPDPVTWRRVAARCTGCHYVVGRCKCAELYEAEDHLVKYEVDSSDMQKVYDTLLNNETFHRHRDEMNGAIHLAQVVRFSPLTSETIAARERVESMMQSNAPEE